MVAVSVLIPARDTRSRAALPALLALLAVAGCPAAEAALAPGDVVLIQSGDSFAAYRYQIVRLDPATLAPTTISPAGGVVQNPAAVVVDRTGAILVADLTAGVVRVDGATGAQSVLTSVSRLGCAPTGICLDPMGGFYLSVNGTLAGVVHLSADGGTVVPVSTGGLLAGPGGLAVGPVGALYVCEGALPPDNGGSSSIHGRGSIVRVEPGSGAQAQIAADPLFYGPFDIAFVGLDEVWTAQAGSVAGRFGCFVRTRLSTGISVLVSTSPCRSQGLAGASGDPVFFSDCNTIGPDCAQLYTSRSPGGPVLLGFGGHLAVVPDGVTPVQHKSWGRLKTIYR